MFFVQFLSVIDRFRKRIVRRQPSTQPWRERNRTPTTGHLDRHRVPAPSVLPVFAVFGALLGSVLGIILALPLRPNAGIVKGEPSPVTLRAPRELMFRSDVLTRQAQDAAANNPALVVTQLDSDLPGRQRGEMERLFERINDVRGNTALAAEQRAAAISALSPSTLSATLAAQIVALPNERWNRITSESVRVYNALWRQEPNGLSEDDVALLRTTTFPTNFIDPSLAPVERDMVQGFVSMFLAGNRTINTQATTERRAAARATVEPVVVTVHQNESIVREGDLVTDVVYEKLQQYGLVFGAGGMTALLQQFLLGTLVAWLLSSYLYFYHASLAAHRRSLGIIGGVAVSAVLAARLLVPAWEPMPYGFPLAVAGILLTLLFDRQIALVIVLALAPLVGLQSDRSIGLSITMALSGAAGVFATQRAARSAIFVWVSAAVALVTTLAAGVFWFNYADGGGWMETLRIPLISVLNGMLSSALAIGTYQLLARAARLLTPLQLLELAHPNQPLLHRLMREAPGTYHHSVVVANLAEVAAEDIGADPLLTRVGAYYHDIGKVIRPYFFTDNQYERSNVHDELDARTSAALIIDHVRDGVKLAHEHTLPQQIIDFILQHHGTMIVSYFYQRALHEDGDVDIEAFRYPGPKPQHRETGILMLADGVEAAVRASSQSGKLRAARPDDTTSRERGGATIGEVVDQIVDDRLRAGQLDECPLTLRDIATIKTSFVKTLQGIYHPRVEYPPAARQPAPEPVSGSV